MIIAVATKSEEQLARSRYKDIPIIVTGIGGTNVIKALNHLPKTIKILNIGYAGSNYLPIGTEVRVGKCKLHHPHVKYKEELYKLEGDTLCFTSTDFVIESTCQTPCVYDMELAFICALGFKVEAIKIVSDNLNLKEYEENIK